jgi:hypothetical protein
VLFKTISSFFKNYSKGGCSLALLKKKIVVVSSVLGMVMDLYYWPKIIKVLPV